MGYLKPLFVVHPLDLFIRILVSFIPPFVGGKKCRKVYVDFVGPLVALFTLLCFLLIFGARTDSLPVVVVLLYGLIAPQVAFVLCKIGRCRVQLLQINSLMGYALYGHLFTLLVSFLLYKEEDNLVFFMCLTIFSGLSTIRVVVVLLKGIPKNGARFLICTVIGTCNVLFSIFLHFAFMHRTFVYGKSTINSN